MIEKNYKYLNDLIKAIKEIEEKFFLRHERDFTYELYHQLRKLKLNIDVTAETPKRPFRIPGELIKNLFFQNYFFSSKNFNLVDNHFSRTPDLLLH